MVKFLTIGADPELFVYDKKNEKHVPVFGMLGGTKEKPLAVDGPKQGFSVQEDNVMAEYNIPPTNSKSEFIEFNKFMIEAINIFLPENHILSFDSFVEFDEETIEHPQAKQFGCAPSINAYTLDIFNPIIDISQTNFRAAGGHIHLGFTDNDSQEVKLKLVQCLDKTLGIRSFLEDFKNNGEINRFYSYGNFGNFRETDFGIEYRTTSNWWLKNEKTMSEAFDLVQKAFDFLNNDNFEFKPELIDLELAEKINNENCELIKI